MSRKANRKMNRAVTTRTELGTQVVTEGDSITLSTPKASVTNIAKARDNRELGWLMADCLSTESAYRS